MILETKIIKLKVGPFFHEGQRHFSGIIKVGYRYDKGEPHATNH